MGGFARFAAQQIADGHAGALAFDIPKRLVDAGDGVVEHGTIAPVTVHHRHIPNLFNAVDIAPEQEGFQVALDGGCDGEDALGEGGAAQAVQPRLGGNDLDDAQARFAGWVR